MLTKVDLSPAPAPSSTAPVAVLVRNLPVSAQTKAWVGVVLTVVVYVAWNVSRRPPPETPWRRRLWYVAEFITFLTWDRAGGDLKAPLTVKPPPPAGREVPPRTGGGGAGGGGA